MRAIAAIIVVGASVVLAAQAPPGQPAFEVVSIKPNTSGGAGFSASTRPNAGWVATNAPTRRIILTAYQLRPFQLIGGPDWIDSDRFDVTAKASDGTPNSQFLPMMRALLAERFTFAAHSETRDLPIYALVLARSDGRLGPQLTRSAADCSSGARGRGGNSGAAAAITPPLPGERPVCGLNVSSNNVTGTMKGGGRPIADLLPSLGNIVDRLVVDRTGLTGTFDLELQWNAAPLAPGGSTSAATDGPSIFTALQEQLGLKLEGARGPVEVLVIDRIEHPTPD